MINLDPTPLTAFLRSQRWFAGKSAPLQSVSVLESLDLSSQLGVDVCIALVQVTYELGLPQRYFVPLQAAADGTLADALGLPGVSGLLFELIRGGERLASGSGALRGEPIGAGKEVLGAISKPPRTRHLGVEQSNSSMVLDDRVIFKLLRKLEPGVYPELELGRFLATQTGFRATPKLLGALQLEGPAGCTVGLVHEYIPNQGDGWSFVTNALRDGMAEAELSGELEELGRSVGELHVALATPTSDPAFAAEPLLREDVQRWSASLIGELGVTLARAASAFPALSARQPLLLERAQRLARIEPSGQKIRQHGDLHLGQVLKGPSGWMIIDFEGEPARSFEQRREKQSPLRDVAGMLRSFTYATGSSKLPEAARAKALETCRAAFLRGYRAVLRGSPLLPDTEDAFTSMLDALELEKALYEIRYELQMRPDWAHIPVNSLLT